MERVGGGGGGGGGGVSDYLFLFQWLIPGFQKQK